MARHPCPEPGKREPQLLAKVALLDPEGHGPVRGDPRSADDYAVPADSESRKGIRNLPPLTGREWWNPDNW